MNDVHALFTLDYIFQDIVLNEKSDNVLIILINVHERDFTYRTEIVWTIVIIQAYIIWVSFYRNPTGFFLHYFSFIHTIKIRLYTVLDVFINIISSKFKIYPRDILPI
uniref:Uncharacterized protein n=1 Tax=Cacopsylla melanoneura TaxID=428564 RepID=A0A8D8YLH6_9HEMI